MRIAKDPHTVRVIASQRSGQVRIHMCLHTSRDIEDGKGKIDSNRYVRRIDLMAVHLYWSRPEDTEVRNLSYRQVGYLHN